MEDCFLPELYSLRFQPYGMEGLLSLVGTTEVFIDDPQSSYGNPATIEDTLTPESTLQPSTVALLLVLLYIAYYQYVIVKKPDVICHDPQRMKELKKHCPVFFENYQVTPWAINSYVQTVVRCIIQSSPVHKKRR